MTLRLFARFFEQCVGGQFCLTGIFVFAVQCSFRPACGFGTFSAQFFDQRIAVGSEARVIGRRIVDASLFRGAVDDGVKLALRRQAKRHWVLRLNFGDVPVATLTNGGDCVARGADQFADRPIRNFRVVAQKPSNAIWLILTL